MVNTCSVQTFINENDQQLRFLVSSLCLRYRIDPTPDSVNDIVQEVYLKILTNGLLEKYDPNYHGHKTKISTYMYAVIRNIIRAWRKTSESKILSCRFQPPREAYNCPDTIDDVEIALRCQKVHSCFQELCDRNAVSDDPDNLGAELRKFETHFSSHCKRYRLNRRRDKTVETSGCSQFDVYRMFKMGMTSHEIAAFYGTSDMFVSYMKTEISDALRDYGIEPGRSHRKPRKKKNRRRKIAS